jgi:hypothetical protein
MYPLQSALRSNKFTKTTVPASDTDGEFSEFPRSGDGRPKLPIMSYLDVSEHSDNVKIMDETFLQEAATFESLEEKRPIRMVTWNIEEKKEEDQDQEETLSMLGKRKLKAWNKKLHVEKRKEEAQSWKLWFWSQGCPCLDWSPTYLFQGIDDQSSMAPSTYQSSVATSTIVTFDEDYGDDDDNSTLQSFKEGSILDESTLVTGNLSDVSSNSSDDFCFDESLHTEMEKELDYIQAKNIQSRPPNIVKDWSREGLSKNTIEDMDVYMEAMRS